MLVFWGRKIVRLLIVLLAVSALTFVMVNLLPGDAAFIIGGEDATVEDIQALREDLGLERPVPARYLLWLGNTLRGDLGQSFVTREPVLSAIAARLPITFEIILISQVMAIGLALPAGIYSAYRSRSGMDRCISGLGFATLSVPGFVMALLLIFVFALRLKWFPATGYVPLSEGIGSNLKSVFLPGLSIALIEWVPLMRVLRSDMIATLKEDFITAARAKGKSTWSILLRDALKPSSLTLITILGLQVGHWIGAAVIIEMIFAIPGIGRLLVNAVFSRDYLMVQGCVLVITVAYVLVNALVDGVYTLLDPRIRPEVGHG